MKPLGVKRQPVIGMMVACFIIQFAIHTGYARDFWSRNYSTDRGIAGSLGPEQILLQLFGFREFLAGILWVRADSFFDQGNYDAVLPIVSVCTVLDPKQLDIYATGMWHIAYNFTDEEQRSDRRYIPSALALGKDGSRQNSNTYEIFFETGWIWYHKIDDGYPNAVKWFELARQREDIQQGRRNLLANAYQRNNQIEESLNLYWSLLEDAEKKLAEQKQNFQRFQMRDTIENNLDTMVVRMVQRGWFAADRNEADKSAYDTSPKFDVGFSARVTVEEPRVINVTGTWNVAPVGTRVRIVLRDAEMKNASFAQLDWDALNSMDLNPDRDSTFMQDQLFVRNRRFRKKIDMSRDPTMYPISESSQNYIVEFYYNPRSAPPHIQDKFGFNGEGFTDKNFLRNDVRTNFMYDLSRPIASDPIVSFERKPLGGDHPVMYTSLMLTRDQLLRRGEWRDKTPVVQTKNFDPGRVSAVDDQVIQVPTLRGSEAPTQPSAP